MRVFTSVPEFGPGMARGAERGLQEAEAEGLCGLQSDFKSSLSNLERPYLKVNGEKVRI